MPLRKTAAAACSAMLALSGAAAAGPLVIDKAGHQVKVKVEAAGGAVAPKLVLHTTMATWCTACRTELPQLAFVRKSFKPEELAMYGLPYDEKERPEQLRDWASRHTPPYRLLTELEGRDIASVKELVLTRMKMDAVPATFITDPQGRILRARWGPPSVSEIRELLRAQAPRK